MQQQQLYCINRMLLLLHCMDQCCTTASNDHHCNKPFFGLHLVLPSIVVVVIVDIHPFEVVDLGNHPFVVVVVLGSHPSMAAVLGILPSVAADLGSLPFVAAVLGIHPSMVVILGNLPFVVVDLGIHPSMVVVQDNHPSMACLVDPSYPVVASCRVVASVLGIHPFVVVDLDNHPYLVIASCLVAASYLASPSYQVVSPSCPWVVASLGFMPSYHHRHSSTYLGSITFAVASSLGSVNIVGLQLID